MLFLYLSLNACSPKITQPLPKPSSPEPKSEDNVVIVKEKKVENPTYTISLILPFKLNEINYKTANLKEIEKISLALDYYQGFKMGLDSVAAMYATNFKLQVIDGKDDENEIKHLSYNENIKKSDLIVGPVYPNTLKIFSDGIINQKISLVSPLAPTVNNLLNNPNLIVINNSLNQHAYVAAEFIKKKIGAKKIILVRSGQAEESKYAIAFKKGVDSLAKGIPFSEIGIKAIGYSNVFKYLNPKAMNTIVLPSTDKLFLSTMLKELEKLSKNYQISVIGHPNWEKVYSLNVETLQNVNAYITSSYYINYQDLNVKQFILNYRKSFNLEPSEYAFKAFDTAFYLGYLFTKEGKNFKGSLLYNDYEGLHNPFHFSYHPLFGYSNKHVMVLKYEDYTMLKVN